MKVNPKIWNFRRVKRKLYSYVKLKKVSKKIVKKKIININFSNLLIKNIPKKSIIFDYMYLNKHTSKHYFVKFFKNSKRIKKKAKSYLFKHIYKYINKNIDKKKTFRHKHHIKKLIQEKKFQRWPKRKKTYFFNSWRGLLSTWKNARLLHWKLYKNGTLKKRRYKIFLPPFLKKDKIVMDIIIKYFCFKFQFSNIFWKDFTKMYLFFFNKIITLKQILQLPLNFLFWIFLKKFRKEKYKVKRKIKSWLYKKIKIKRTFWMNRKRKIPNFFSKQMFYFRKIKSIIQYDYITNYFCILKKSIGVEKINQYIFNNLLLKMHNFRYKA